jgi:hypothetical protein
MMRNAWFLVSSLPRAPLPKDNKRPFGVRWLDTAFFLWKRAAVHFLNSQAILAPFQRKKAVSSHRTPNGFCGKKYCV